MYIATLQCLAGVQLYALFNSPLYEYFTGHLIRDQDEWY